MARILHPCPYCNKKSEVTDQQAVTSDFIAITRQCGHTEIIPRQKLELAEYSAVDGSGKSAYRFQIEGIKFCEKTNFNALVADAMGLGKTIQALLAIRNGGFKKTLIVQKSATTYQWLKEAKTWLNNSNLVGFPIIGTKGLLLDGFQTYVLSMDSLSRNKFWKKLAERNFDSLIIDECHSFKDINAERTKALMAFISNSKLKAKILLTGTPIKNRANEYFTPLNILAPEHFWSPSAFQRKWLIQNDKGIYNRIAPWRLDQFKELISRWVIRREKEEVLTDLPALQQNEVILEPDYSYIAKYNSELAAFREEMIRGLKPLQILGWLTKLRQIAAASKVIDSIERIDDFITSTNEKIAIGVHHKGIMAVLKDGLESRGHSVLTLSGEHSPAQKSRIICDFEKPENKILILSELAGGYGINLQFCANCDILERQWNYADEEQFVSRFHRDGQKKAVTADYLGARGTIDEWFSAMIQEKKAIFGETIQGWRLTEDYESLKELAWKAINNPL